MTRLRMRVTTDKFNSPVGRRAGSPLVVRLVFCRPEADQSKGRNKWRSCAKVARLRQITQFRPCCGGRHLLNQKRLNRAWQGARWLLGLGSKRRGREEGRRKSNYVHEPIYPGKGQRPMKGRHERRRQSEGPKNNARRTRRRRKQAP